MFLKFALFSVLAVTIVSCASQGLYMPPQGAPISTLSIKNTMFQNISTHRYDDADRCLNTKYTQLSPLKVGETLNVQLEANIKHTMSIVGWLDTKLTHNSYEFTTCGGVYSFDISKDKFYNLITSYSKEGCNFTLEEKDLKTSESKIVQMEKRVVIDRTTGECSSSLN